MSNIIKETATQRLITLGMGGVLAAVLLVSYVRRRRRLREICLYGAYKHKIVHNPSPLYDPTKYYNHVIISRGVRPLQPAIITIAGQVALDENKNLIGGDDKKAQARKAYLNLRSAIESTGATVNDVVKVTVYVVNYKEEDMEAIEEGSDLCFGQGKRNYASTLIGVQSLARANLLIEVEAMAIINTINISKELDGCSRRGGWGWFRQCGKGQCGKGQCGKGQCGKGNSENKNKGTNQDEKKKVNKYIYDY